MLRNTCTSARAHPKHIHTNLCTHPPKYAHTPLHKYPCTRNYAHKTQTHVHTNAYHLYIHTKHIGLHSLSPSLTLFPRQGRGHRSPIWRKHLQQKGLMSIYKCVCQIGSLSVVCLSASWVFLGLPPLHLSPGHRQALPPTAGLLLPTQSPTFLSQPQGASPGNENPLFKATRDEKGEGAQPGICLLGS